MPSISITNPENITSLNLGTSSPRLGGTLQLTNFGNLKTLYGKSHDITAVNGIDNLTKLEIVQLQDNEIPSDLLDFSSSTNCKLIDLQQNKFTGGINIGGVANEINLPTNIEVFRCNKNNLGTQTLPSLAAFTKLSEFNISGQSNTFDGVAHSGNPKWNGPSTVESNFAISNTIRIFNVSQTRLSQAAKKILVTALYDAFLASHITPGNTISSVVNGRTYNTPTIRINGATSAPTGNLNSPHTTVSIADAKQALGDIGFTAISGMG
jgi:Leucine-rich repeat (LRR) protein